MHVACILMNLYYIYILVIRIVRAFLIEEQKIVVRAVKAQQSVMKQQKQPKDAPKQKKKQQPKKK